jgi:hypothetical protein
MIPNPHDALFKWVFGQPEHARGALRAILPAALAEALDWSTLTLQPGSFVDAALRHQHTDLLYAATWRDGGQALVYLLFEHQSTPPTEGLMAERLLGYQVRIWDRWRADHPRARTLPMIVPIVMYHGASPWPEARSFDALLDVPAGLRPPATGKEASPVPQAASRFQAYELLLKFDEDRPETSSTTCCRPAKRWPRRTRSASSTETSSRAICS